jgi:hypothetical protein
VLGKNMVKILLLLISFKCLYSAPSKIKSGYSNLKPTQHELEKKAQRLTQTQKKELHFKQLSEILPQEIIHNVSYETLSKIDFSPSDDDITRAKKYEKLGLTLLNSETKTRKNKIIHMSFYYAFAHLQKLERYLKGKYNIDYYLSTAQISFWAARFCQQQERKDKLLLSAKYFLNNAINQIENIPTQQEFEEASYFVSTLLEKITARLPVTRLNELALDPLTKLSLEDFSEKDNIYLSTRLAQAKEKLSKIPDLSEDIIFNTLQKYSLSIKDKIKSEQKSKEEKISCILKQDKLQIFHHLVRLDLVDGDDLEKIKVNNFLERMELEDQYKFLAKKSNLSDSIKESFQKSILKLHDSLEKE